MVSCPKYYECFHDVGVENRARFFAKLLMLFAFIHFIFNVLIAFISRNYYVSSWMGYDLLLFIVCACVLIAHRTQEHWYYFPSIILNAITGALFILLAITGWYTYLNGYSQEFVYYFVPENVFIVTPKNRSDNLVLVERSELNVYFLI